MNLDKLKKSKAIKTYWIAGAGLCNMVTLKAFMIMF